MAETRAPDPKQTLVALDTNVLLDLSEGDETAIDCVENFRNRLAQVQFVVPPTVIQELAHFAVDGETNRERASARRALQSMVRNWGFTPFDCVPVGNGIVDETGRKIRQRGLLPDDEINDSFVIVEAGLIGASVLVSSDGHLWGIDQFKLRQVLEDADISVPVIFSPAQVVRDHYLKK